MQDSKLKNIITNLFKEHLEAKILRLENRNIIETKDLKFITIEFEKLKRIIYISSFDILQISYS